MRKKRLLYNTFSSLLFQLTTIICGFVLPKLILSTYGSEVNGVVNSVTQFLQIIAFLELGVGAVVQSALYKPLHEKNDKEISLIVASANKFFSKLAIILLVYVVVLVFIYPLLVNGTFDFFYTAFLILAMSISSFSQYYFGVVDRLLLTADQRGYVQYTAQTVTLLVNTIACVFLINIGTSIQLVKLTTSIIYLMRPIFLRYYVNSHYRIDRKVAYEGEPIKQKWNGIAQHVAAVVLDGTDLIVLTMFSTLTNVSIYSVYYLVVSGVKQLFTSTLNGFHSLLGEIWATGDRQKLNKIFSSFEWLVHSASVLIWGCTFVLIVPFVEVYTFGVKDANYAIPMFALFITLANAMHSLRLPYNIMILSAGHYKQTQHCYIIAAMLNIVSSVILVINFGLIGVAVGTLIAMCYQTLWMVIYNYKHLLSRNFAVFIKQAIVDVCTFFICWAISKSFVLNNYNYLSWCILALKVFSVWFIVVLCINVIIYKDNIIMLKKFIVRK